MQGTMLNSQQPSAILAQSPQALRKPEPKALKRVPGRACHNCKTDASPMWRRRFCPDGAYSCNACYMYAKNHGGAMRKVTGTVRPSSPSSSVSSMSSPSMHITPLPSVSSSMIAFRKALQLKQAKKQQRNPQYQCRLHFYSKPVSKMSLGFISMPAAIRFVSQRDGSSLVEAACRAPLALPKLPRLQLSVAKHDPTMPSDADAAFLVSELRSL